MPQYLLIQTLIILKMMKNRRENDYDNDGLDPSEEYFRKKENDDDTYFPTEESEPPHY